MLTIFYCRRVSRLSSNNGIPMGHCVERLNLLIG